METKLQEYLERLWVNLDALNTHLEDYSTLPPVASTETVYADLISSLRDVYGILPSSLKTLKKNKHNARVRYQEFIAEQKDSNR